ncbi:helix-turn-helix domain-containing protein [Amycolatopsis nalaikhensis]|uniref:Helix-turn-helix transcriptional regulator n=1 Tax=Amycolatopsis nalaikhensis TaxID=715472 RepID=A0ABY8XYI2_9PSEU|nr:helix-turn-helix transcriptional regulator [Amycolatopsis sp. 2-2]WIV60784.1 helix-turn-helix transcriptional regulator [Amycolatopsis sp. 2-2]
MAITQTVPLLMLVNELNRLKTASGIKDAEAARHLGCQPSKINRILLGQSKISPGDAKLLGELYGAAPELVEVLLDLARNLGQKGDWTSYRAVYAESFRMLLDLEQYSNRIRQVQSEIVPGLLQTEGYVRALNEAPRLGTRFNTEDVVAARRHRQAILTRQNAPSLSFVLSESCLRRTYGDQTVMRGQLERLIELTDLSNVQVQILPFRNRSPVTYTSLNFELINIPGPGIASPLNFVYVEQYDDARYLDDEDRVDAYEQLWGYIQAAALGPVDSAEFIGKVADEYR